MKFGVECYCTFYSENMVDFELNVWRYQTQFSLLISIRSCSKYDVSVYNKIIVFILIDDEKKKCSAQQPDNKKKVLTNGLFIKI